MAIVKAKPTSPGRRFRSLQTEKDLYKGRPLASLLTRKNKTGGRNNSGRITTRHIGGGHKQHYRIIDFKRNKDNIPAKVERIEYDPNRSSFIALLLYKDGERRYIISPKGLKVNDLVMSGSEATVDVGNTLLLKDIPYWTWGLEGESTFWYPSMRLFRQNERNNWQKVMETVSKTIQKEMEG